MKKKSSTNTEHEWWIVNCGAVDTCFPRLLLLVPVLREFPARSVLGPLHRPPWSIVIDMPCVEPFYFTHWGLLSRYTVYISMHEGIRACTGTSFWAVPASSRGPVSSYPPRPTTRRKLGHNLVKRAAGLTHWQLLCWLFASCCNILALQLFFLLFFKTTGLLAFTLLLHATTHYVL